MCKDKHRLRVAIVGIGHQAIEDHIPGVMTSENAKLVSICDINEELMNEATKDLELNKYTDLDEMLEKEKLDFVIVCTPHNSHKEIVEKAIRKGIHVLKEKPFAISMEDAKYLKELAEEKDVKIMTTLQRRFNPIYNTFFQFIDLIGTPFMVDIKYSLYVKNPHEGWRGIKKESGGGCILDMGYHMIDLLMWYFGLPSEVHAETSCLAKPDEDYDAEDTANIIFKYPTGLHGIMKLSRAVPPKEEFIKVFGSNGSIHIERGKIARYDLEGKEIECLTRINAWPSASTKQIDYFCKVILEGKANLGAPEFHLNHMAFIEACYKSNSSGKYVKPREILQERWLKN